MVFVRHASVYKGGLTPPTVARVGHLVLGGGYPPPRSAGVLGGGTPPLPMPTYMVPYMGGHMVPYTASPTTLVVEAAEGRFYNGGCCRIWNHMS